MFHGAESAGINQLGGYRNGAVVRFKFCRWICSAQCSDHHSRTRLV